MLKIFSIIFILLIVISFGCSSVSSVERYNKTKKDNSKQSDIRFTSENDTSYLVEDEDVPEELDPSDLPENTTSYELSEILKKIKSENLNHDNADVSELEEFLMEIVKYYKTPYKFGGNSLKGIDCSGFTKSIYKNVLEIDISRSAREQYQEGEVIDDKSKLEFGDLVFFNTRRRVRPGHVGIYLWDNLFVHASTKHGVIITSLDEEYYSKRYMGARRIKPNGFNIQADK